MRMTPDCTSSSDVVTQQLSHQRLASYCRCWQAASPGRSHTRAPQTVLGPRAKLRHDRPNAHRDRLLIRGSHEFLPPSCATGTVSLVGAIQLERQGAPPSARVPCGLLRPRTASSYDRARSVLVHEHRCAWRQLTATRTGVPSLDTLDSFGKRLPAAARISVCCVSRPVADARAERPGRTSATGSVTWRSAAKPA